MVSPILFKEITNGTELVRITSLSNTYRLGGSLDAFIAFIIIRGFRDSKLSRSRSWTAYLISHRSDYKVLSLTLVLPICISAMNYVQRCCCLLWIRIRFRARNLIRGLVEPLFPQPTEPLAADNVLQSPPETVSVWIDLYICRFRVRIPTVSNYYSVAVMRE